MYIEIINKIKEYQTITIFGHIFPDGDCYGSKIGLREALRETFPDKVVLATGTGFSSFASRMGQLDNVSDETIKKSLAIVVDTSSAERIEDQRYILAKEIIKIDHHIFNHVYGVIEWIDNSAVAACQMITMMIKNGHLKLNKNGAEALFLGMMTDSNRFQFAPSGKQTFEATMFLLDYGVDMPAIFEQLYLVVEDSLRFKGYMLLNYKKTPENIVYLIMNKETIAEFGFTAQKAATMVNTIGNIVGSPIWVYFAECEDGTVKVEFRSSKVNVQSTAVKYGGGGHHCASGCNIASLDMCQQVLDDLAIVVEGENKECGKKN